MKKAIVVSDIHVHNYKQFNAQGQRIAQSIKLINYIFRFADKNEINLIMFCGDLFDKFEIISVLVINAVTACFRENFEKYPGIEWLAISGNHDYATKNTIESPGASGQYFLSDIFRNNYYLLDGGMMDDGEHYTIVTIPYFSNMDDFRKCMKINYPPFTRENLYLMMHQTVWPENPMVPNDIEPDDSIFDPFTQIFNGHIHHPASITEKFINVGSPIHRDAGDVGIRKGFWVVDLADSNVIPAFWDLTDKYPQYIRKPYGTPVNEWEAQQYIVWYHPEDMKKAVKQDFDSAKFASDLTPKELVTNYCKEVIPNDNDKLKAGLKLIEP